MGKRIGVITVVRNDDFYLRKWVEYYGRELGRENLYVYFDGKDQTIPDFCEGVNCSLEEKIPGKVVEMDKRRSAFVSDKAGELFEAGYELVIGVDADEYLVADPASGKGLGEFLSELKMDGTVSGLGVDVGQLLGEEPDIDENRPFLEQRHYARLGTRYTKASVISRPLRWGSGFHRIKGHNFHIAKGLYLFHLGYFDMGRIQARFADVSRRESGWTKHLERRSETIRLVTGHKKRDWDRWTRRARMIQTCVRPPYAWNKPAMFEAVIIVEIPARFRSII